MEKNEQRQQPDKERADDRCMDWLAWSNLCPAAVYCLVGSVEWPSAIYPVGMVCLTVVRTSGAWNIERFWTWPNNQSSNGDKMEICRAIDMD